MSNHALHEICSKTGKWMLTRRDAGEIVSLAKKKGKGTYFHSEGNLSVPFVWNVPYYTFFAERYSAKSDKGKQACCL